MRQKHSLIQSSIVRALTTVVGLALLIALAFSLNALFSSRGRQPPQMASQPQRPGVPQLLSTPTPTANQPRAPVSQQPPTTPTIATDQTDPTAGWKTYTSIPHRFSTKYPPSWTLRETPNVVVSSPGIEKTLGGTVIGGGEVVIFVDDHPPDRALPTLFNISTTKDLRVIERREVSINNLSALWYVAEGAGIDGTMTGVMVTTESKVYRIESYYGRKDKEEIVKVLELMLTSMEFATK